MVTIMLTTSWIIPVHDRVWSMVLGNPVDNAPCRLDRVLHAADFRSRRSLAKMDPRCRGGPCIGVHTALIHHKSLEWAYAQSSRSKATRRVSSYLGSVRETLSGHHDTGNRH
eukprot:scaffold17254_cov38-Phaeocystis_antarctica.AAC.1